MKNLIFAMCGFLMMSLVSLGVQASNFEPSKCEQVNLSVDVGLPPIQCFTLEVTPADCVAWTMPQTLFLVTSNPTMMCTMKEETAIRMRQLDVPKCPFRYIYKSKYCTHYSYTAYSKLITPY